jgi:secreted trypsin-like serine protease
MTKTILQALLLLQVVTVVYGSDELNKLRRGLKKNDTDTDTDTDLAKNPIVIASANNENNNNNNNNNTIIPKKQVRVVGGMKVTNNTEYPYIAFPMGDKNCVATLFHDDLLITAANCGTAFDKGVFLGGVTIDGKTSQKVKVLQTIKHPKFNSETNEYDIMILKLGKTFTSIPKVKLNFYDPVLPKVGELLDVLGYGATSKTQYYSDTLQKARILAAANDRCDQYRWFNNETMVCTWFPAGGRDSCDGDSGGPILLKNSNMQIALVSYGLECGNREFPSVNTRISAYQMFIRTVMCQVSAVKPTGTTCSNLTPMTLKSSSSTTPLINPLASSGSNPLLGSP